MVVLPGNPSIPTAPINSGIDVMCQIQTLRRWQGAADELIYAGWLTYRE
jgi:hypothetical protein